MSEIIMHYNPIDDRFYIYRSTEYEYDTQSQKDAFHMYDLLCDIAKKENRGDKYICKKCLNGVYMQAFSKSACNRCCADVVTPHMPSYKLCEKCSKLLKVCQQCGGVICE